MEGPLLWSAEQHALISAMGLSVYAHVDVQPWPAARPMPVVREPMVSATAPRQPFTAPAPPRRAAVPASPMESTVADSVTGPAAVQPPVDDRMERPVRPRRPPGGVLAAMPDRLMLAVLRASGLNPGAPDTSARIASWPIESLRSDPSAKRALWAELRQLRKRRTPH